MIEQLKSWQASPAAMRRIGGGLLILLCVGVAPAQQLQGAATSAETAQSSLTRVVTPTYLEKSVDPYAVNPQAGWQVGGVSSLVNSKINGGSLNFSGGYYFSRTLAPHNPLEAAPQAQTLRFGMGVAESAQEQMPAYARLFMRDAQPQQDALSDQLAYQRLKYEAKGLSISGSYADVGKDFQGLDVLTRQLAGSDADGAKLLGLGLRQTNYTANYSGIRGVNFTSASSTTENTQTGHQENGLTRTRTSNGIRLALGQRNALEYSITGLVEEWDQTKVRKARNEVDTSALKLAGSFGKGSQYALGQSLTSTTQETAQMDLRQRDLSLRLGEWKNFSLAGSYANKLTEQTQVTNNLLNLDLSAILSPTMKLTGKLAENELIQADGTTTPVNNLLGIKLVSTLLPNVKASSEYQQVETQANGEVTTLDHQAAWTLSPKWMVSARNLHTDSAHDGLSTRTEYSLTGQLGTAQRAQQVGVLARTDALPQEVCQHRTELTYAHALGDGTGAPTLLTRTGRYELDKPDSDDEEVMAAVQLLSLHPVKQATLALGYYDGPAFGANALAYRAWGVKPPANTEVWSAQDFAAYTELGGELTIAVTPKTTLVLKRFDGEKEGVGALQTVEYGIEQGIGLANLRAARTYTTDPGKGALTNQERSWWRLILPFGKPLPTWAANSLRAVVFTDGALWGFGQAPAWVATPTAGLTISRDTMPLPNGKPVDQSSVQFAGLVREKLFVNSSYERNPVRADNRTLIDATHRGTVQLSYAVNPRLQLFGRYLGETRQDQASAQYMRTLGLCGQFSPSERLQLQFDQQKRFNSGASLTGNSYAVQYERIFREDHFLVLKYRLSPEEFNKPEDVLKMEATYRLAF